jgi:fibro-slime domain-containing protein
MRHVLKASLLACPLALACGDDGREGSATAVSTSPTGVSGVSGVLTEGSSSSGSGTTADNPTGSGSASDGTTGDGTTTTTTTATTTGITSFPGTSTTFPDSTGFDPPACNPVLQATIRDFKVEHPDFEDYTGDAAYTGLVLPDLGPDKNPVHAAPGGTPQTTGPAEFAQWYSDVAGVNIPFFIDIPLTEVMPGQFTFQDDDFFPIDNQGWGNEFNPNNFHFTTEIHIDFTYEGGEVFTFIGDDDLWLFINNKLAIDLGGTHPQLSDSVDLDADAAYLGITPGNTYSMDIFHAERHTDQSHFRIDTSISCFMIPG